MKRFISLLLVFTVLLCAAPMSTVNVSAASDDLIWPCESAYYVTCLYYYKDGDQHSTRYGYTKGIDISGGGNIVAAESGTVETATTYTGGFGKHVVIKHASGYRTLYAHLSSYCVTAGQTVTKGQKIGVMGSTGNSSGTHLHFEYEGADPWKTQYNSKYASKIMFEQNVRSNNNSYNSDKTIVNVIDSNYYKSGTYYYYSGSGTHTSHSYSGQHWEAAHPHKYYETCSCGATRYIEGKYYTYTDGSCASCSMVQDSKYNTVKGFKAYPCVTSNFEVKTSDLTTRGGEIYTTDYCTINALYTNGWCQVTFPMDGGGTRTAYTQISKFIKTPSASLTKYTADKYINLYSTSSLSTQLYRIYPGDVCYTIGTSGSATQIFMPMSSGGYYVLGWVKTSDINGSTPPATAEKLNPGLTSLSASNYAKCYTIANSQYAVYTSSSLSTRGYEGTASPSAWTGESDEVWIIGVGVNSAGTAYAKIQYPVGSSRYTAYVPLHSTLVPGSLADTYRTAKAKVTGLSDRAGGSSNSAYWVDAGEKVYLLSQQNGYSQILYPTSTTGWRIAWCTNSTYESMFAAQTYTVSYNANGGTGAPASQTKTHGTALTLSSTKPTQTGHTFVGWATSSSATTAAYSAGSIYTNEASVTLYAVWRKQSFTITYDANGGSNAPGSQSQTYGTAITITSSKPQKDYTVTFNANGGTVSPANYSVECTFTGWNTNKNGTGTTYKAGSSYTPNTNATLYAIYSNPTLGSFPVPAKTGYVFNGWYTAASGGNKVSSTTTITQDTTLYAQWTIQTYTVVYFDDGSSNLPADQIKTYGQALTLSSTVPVKEGYTFKGWTTEEGSTTVSYIPGSQYTNNDWVVLYAVWEKNPVTVTGIEIESMPAKTVYQIGDSLDTAGLTLKIAYSDGTSENVASGFTTSGFDSATAGTKTIIVSYGDVKTTYSVTVEEPVVTGAKYGMTDTSGTAGSTVEIYVSISNNPGIISLRNTISYDTQALELIQVEDCGLLEGYTTPSATIASPYTLRWVDSLAINNNTAEGNIVKLTFRILEDVAVGSYTVSVNPIEARDANGAKVVFSGTSAIVSVIDCMIGDTDGDGEISDWDSILLNRYLAGWGVELDLAAADIDGDGEVSDWDSIVLARYLAGWTTDLES